MICLIDSHCPTLGSSRLDHPCGKCAQLSGVWKRELPLSAHDAVRATQAYALGGKNWVVDLDIEKFFDRVHHDILMRRIGEAIRDKRVLKLIGSYLRSGILVEGRLVNLAAAEAYGPRREELIQRVAIKHLQPVGGGRLRAGGIARVHTDRGWRQVTVLKLGKFQATVDANHPLAGRDVAFDIEVTAVRKATPEELAHGHAHGADGSDGHH